MNQRLVVTTLLLASISLGGCKFLKKKAPEDVAATAAATPSAAPVAVTAPPTPEPAPPVAAAAYPTIDESTVPAPQDFEDEAFDKVTPANFKAELARLNKEITAPAAAAR